MFRHELPFDRSSLTRWRQRLGEEQIAALLQESLSVAHRSGAIETKDLERVVVDTTVQEKAIAHPTDARLTHRAIEKLVDLAKREGVELRQSYLRLAKRAAIMVGRYTHAHQFKRARRELKFLRTRLGRIIRDIRRKIEGNTRLEDRFGPLLDLASRVRHQEQRQRGPEGLFAARARGGVHRQGQGPRALRVRLQGLDCHARSPRPRAGSSCCTPRRCTATPMTAIRSVPSSPISKSSQVLPCAASTATRAIAVTTIPHRFKVWITGQVRRVTKAIRREMRRRAAVEPVIRSQRIAVKANWHRATRHECV